MHTLLPTAAEPAMDVLAAPSLDSFRDLAITLVGSFIAILILIRLAGAWTRRAWGEIAVEIAAVMAIGYFVWFPDQGLQQLKDWSSDLWGSNTTTPAEPAVPAA